MQIKAFVGTLSLIAALTATLIVSSCNSSDTPNNYNTYTYGSTAVTGFSLQPSSKILEHLDSVFFSINLDNATIYNAQPLPYGTKIDAFTVDITTDNCSKVELNYKTKFGNDTTLNYLDNKSDSINFAEGPVVLHVVSYDGLSSRNYRIFVNVYESDPDSIMWELQSASLPEMPSGITETRFAEMEGIYYMLATDGTDYWMNSTDDLYNVSKWYNIKKVDFGMTPKIESFTGCQNIFYILDESNNLYSSEDFGETWTDCGTTMNYIYGSYQDKILGVRLEGSSVVTVVYPGSQEPILQPVDFPVSGTSALLTHYTPWEVNPLAIMAGGTTINGEPVGDVWAFDGDIWAKIGSGSLPQSSGRTLFQYDIAETDSVSWKVTKRTSLFSFGGTDKEGVTDSKVYLSKDLGVHWVEAPADMQFAPEFRMPANAQVFVQPQITGTESRAIAPITEWLCPYIYLMGGKFDDGTLNDEIWMGVMTRYTFAPLE